MQLASRSGLIVVPCCAETDDIYDDDTASELSLEVGAEAGPEFEAQAQAQRQLHATSALSGPAAATGEPAAAPSHQSALRRFSKDHAVSEDVIKRFMIAVENDEKAAKKRVQDMLVSWDAVVCKAPSQAPTPLQC